MIYGVFLSPNASQPRARSCFIKALGLRSTFNSAKYPKNDSSRKILSLLPALNNSFHRIFRNRAGIRLAKVSCNCAVRRKHFDMEDGMAERIANFDDWKDLFYKWQSDIGFDAALVNDYKFAAIYDDGTGPDIEFGDFKGRKKFTKVSTFRRRICATRCTRSFYRGDTGVQLTTRKLIDAAPAATIVNACCASCARSNGIFWQMCRVLINNFGDSGKLEAQNNRAPRLQKYPASRRVQ